MTRSDPSAYLQGLDPLKDCEEIVRTLQTVIFPWDSERSLEFALFRTYSVPSISALLAKTGQFTQHTRKRYDDTELLLTETLENGFDSARGREAIGRINAMHGRYSISNDNYLYVLSTFVFEPMRWLQQYGWRPLTSNEQQAWFNYYLALGRRLKIHSLPATLEDFEAFNRRYEAEHFRPAPSNSLIACCTKKLFLGFYLPKSLLWLGSPLFNALLDEPLSRALGFKTCPTIIRSLVHTGLKLRAATLRLLPKNTRVHSFTARARPSYPMGYAIKDLGSQEPESPNHDRLT